MRWVAIWCGLKLLKGEMHIQPHANVYDRPQIYAVYSVFFSRTNAFNAHYWILRHPLRFNCSGHHFDYISFSSALYRVRALGNGVCVCVCVCRTANDRHPCRHDVHFVWIHDQSRACFNLQHQFLLSIIENFQFLCIEFNFTIANYRIKCILSVKESIVRKITCKFFL